MLIAEVNAMPSNRTPTQVKGHTASILSIAMTAHRTAPPALSHFLAFSRSHFAASRNINDSTPSCTFTFRSSVHSPRLIS